MFIQPDSVIYLCKDVPLDLTYDNTITFGTKDSWDYEAQFNYFYSKVDRAIVKEKYSYVKDTNGVIRVEGPADDYLMYNYLFYKNKNFSDKWFYAFITNVEFINPGTTYIYFELDVMQTWFPDITFDECLIEREHVEDDSLYANLTDEGIEIGELVAYDDPAVYDEYLGTRMLVIGTTENPIGNEGVNIPFDPNEVLFGDYVDNFVIPNDEISITDVDVESENKVTFDDESSCFRIPLEVVSFEFNCIADLTTAEANKFVYRFACSYNQLTSNYEFVKKQSRIYTGDENV